MQDAVIYICMWICISIYAMSLRELSSFILYSCLMDSVLVFCGLYGLMNVWHGIPEQLLWAFCFYNWKKRLELSNDGINGIFDLVISVDKKCFVYPCCCCWKGRSVQKIITIFFLTSKQILKRALCPEERNSDISKYLKF